MKLYFLLAFCDGGYTSINNIVAEYSWTACLGKMSTLAPPANVVTMYGSRQSILFFNYFTAR